MSFTRRQQTLYRPLVDNAWARHAALERLAQGSKIERDAWYRDQLQKVAGITSTTQANRTTHFGELMAHFEAIVGESIYWQTQLAESRLRRVRFALNKLCREHEVEESYVAGIALQMFGTRDLPRLGPDQLEAIITALKRKLRIYTAPRPESRARRTAEEALANAA